MIVSTQRSFIVRNAICSKFDDHDNDEQQTWILMKIYMAIEVPVTHNIQSVQQNAKTTEAILSLACHVS